MHENIRLPCIFGCSDEQDELLHYMFCPYLWQFVADIFKVDISAHITHRLLLVDPNPIALKCLACAHSIYHSCKNDGEIVASIVEFVNSGQCGMSPWSVCHDRAHGYAKGFVGLVD